ncbi:hypothetical protein [Agreia bicolorata]|uniref:Uncharacterized protein n=1 Tax=Agreia bicolorata TaxID=110935 RepID=A0ABR5CFN5_9MICO|nr:hypothetical protein [Agreia bicolorata]KJC64478.1 hypothetical protein TZ00_08720 [Agreia bicolorata]
MTDLTSLPDSLPQTFFFPWANGTGYPDDPTAFTLALSNKLRLPVTVLCSSQSSLPDPLRKAAFVTPRVNHAVRGPSIVLLHYPDYRLIDHIPLSYARHVVAAEVPSHPLDVWAAKREAFNVRAGKTMTLDIDDRVREIYERILWNGNNAWSDKPGKRDALQDLTTLRNMDALDRDSLIGYLLDEKGSWALDTLAKLIKQAQTK